MPPNLKGMLSYCAIVALLLFGNVNSLNLPVKSIPKSEAGKAGTNFER